jgi:hypothetical protein
MKIRQLALTAVAAFALFGASQASAQTIGFKVGAAFANVDVDDFDSESLTSLMGGGFVRFGMGGFGIQPELLFVTRGYEVEELGVTGKFKIDYIEVPILAVVPIAMGGIAPYLFAGPSFAFKIGCNVEVDDDSEDCGDDDGLKSTDIGATVGGGLEFPMGPGALLVEGRYNFGLSNISDTEGTDAKTRTAAILAGYSIPLGPRM